MSFQAFIKTLDLFKKTLLRNPTLLWPFCVTLVLIGIDVACAGLVPFYSKQIVDGIQHSHSVQTALLYSVMLLAVFWSIDKVIHHLQEITFFPVVNRAIRDITFEVVNHIHEISYVDYKKLSIPELISSVKRISQSSRAFIRILILLFVPTLLKVILATVIALKFGALGVSIFVGFCFAFFTLTKGMQWYIQSRTSAWEITDKVTMRVTDSVFNTKMVRPYLPFERKALKSLLQEEAMKWQAANTKLHLVHVWMGLVLGISYGVTLTLGLLGIHRGFFSAGDFVLLQGQLLAAFLPFKSFSLEIRQLAESIVDIHKIVNILNIGKMNERNKEKNSEVNREKQAEGIEPNGLAIKSIQFGHEACPYLFRNLNLTVPAGEKIGILGNNGSGKSTLVGLCTGLYKPSAGTVSVDLTKVLSIAQDYRLFNDSILYNLTYGLNDKYNNLYNEIHNILKVVGLDQLIQELPKGLDTPVGEMGIRMSGGEKQRIALARALLMQPEILILDESLEAIQIEDQQKILHYLCQKISTVMIITHRANLLKDMDRVLILENGKLEDVSESLIQSKVQSKVSSKVQESEILSYV